MWGLCFPPWTALLCAEKPALAFVRKQSTSWPTAQHECKAPLVGRGSNTEEMRTLGRIIPSTRSLPISLADQTLPLQITIHPRPCVHKHFTILNALLIPFISFLFFFFVFNFSVFSMKLLQRNNSYMRMLPHKLFIILWTNFPKEFSDFP